MGTPVVTLGRKQRKGGGRLVQGFYEWAGMAAGESGERCCDAASVKEYVEMSVRLANDGEFRQSIVTQIESKFNGQLGEGEGKVCEGDVARRGGDGARDKIGYYTSIADFIVSSTTNKENG